MALSGLRVFELEGIGPGPLSSCILADFGADVITICRASGGKVRSQGDPVSRGKRSIALDLKQPSAVTALKRMVKNIDVFIEPYRPGVVEKLGIGPKELMEINPRLIYGRMTGWGQGGDPKFTRLAGHDANYLALSGTLDLFNRAGTGPGVGPLAPANFAGDYAGGGVMMAMGVLLAVIERQKSGLGQVIDAAMVDGASYIALPLFKWQQNGMVPLLKNGHVDKDSFFLNEGPHFSATYCCSDGEFVAVQALEPKFYMFLLKGLFPSGIPKGLPKQQDRSSWPWMKTRFAKIFLTKTRDEWADIFYGIDACVAPILTSREAAKHPHNVARGTFAPTPGSNGKLFEPAPAPKLSRTPGYQPRPNPNPGEHTRIVLAELGVDPGNIDILFSTGAAVNSRCSKL